MPFDWKEYLNLAKSLQKQHGNDYSQECAFRSAISRAYYAAFCYARNYIRDHENFLPHNSAMDHSLVREHFRQQGRFDISNTLNYMIRWRNTCDYEDTIGKDLRQTVSETIQYAQEIIDRLK
jgi:uncharacterized protein (UPF0332 family)